MKSKKKSRQTDMIMPWGKYKGKHISELSHGYVSTLLDNTKITDLKLRSALEIQRGVKYKELQQKTRRSYPVFHDYEYEQEYNWHDLEFGDLC